MKTRVFKSISLLILIAGLILLSGCPMLMSHETGILEGKISIGPICPVETDPPNPACLPTAETYKAYPVSVWSATGKTKITSITPALDGLYHLELSQGNYLVILENEHNRIGSSNLPTEILIRPFEKTILNIDIDTGIR